MDSQAFQVIVAFQVILVNLVSQDTPAFLDIREPQAILVSQV